MLPTLRTAIVFVVGFTPHRIQHAASIQPAGGTGTSRCPAGWPAALWLSLEIHLYHTALIAGLRGDSLSPGFLLPYSKPHTTLALLLVLSAGVQIFWNYFILLFSVQAPPEFVNLNLRGVSLLFLQEHMAVGKKQLSYSNGEEYRSSEGGHSIPSLGIGCYRTLLERAQTGCDYIA